VPSVAMKETDLEADRERAVRQADCQPGDEHDRDHDVGAVALLSEDGADHGQEADHIAKREVKLAGDQRQDGGKSHAGNDRLHDEEIRQVPRRSGTAASRP